MGYRPPVPRETDKQRLELLREIFSSRTSNEPAFTRTAQTGGHRPDEGLESLLPADLTRDEKRRLVKQAIAEVLDAGGLPEVIDKPGDVAMKLDARRVHMFRVEVPSVRLAVQVDLDDSNPRTPHATVISVKRDYAQGE